MSKADKQFKKIVDLRHRGETALAEAEYEKVEGISKKIINFLDTIESKAV